MLNWKTSTNSGLSSIVNKPDHLGSISYSRDSQEEKNDYPDFLSSADDIHSITNADITSILHFHESLIIFYEIYLPFIIEVL